MKRFLNWVCIVLLVAILFVFVFYLPEIDAGILERQYVNQSTVVKQDKQEQGIHYELPLVNKIWSLCYAEFSTEILSIHSIADMELEDEALLVGLQSQISILEKSQLIPDLVDTEQLRTNFQEALYYNINNVENPSAVVSVWKLIFYDADNFQYQFVIDASTYKIYAAAIYGDDVCDFWLKKGIYADHVERVESEKLRKITDEMGEQLRYYYGAQDLYEFHSNVDGNFASEEVLSYEDVHEGLHYDEGRIDYDNWDINNAKEYITEIPVYLCYRRGTGEYMDGMYIGIVVGAGETMLYDDVIGNYYEEDTGNYILMQ